MTDPTLDNTPQADEPLTPEQTLEKLLLGEGLVLTPPQRPIDLVAFRNWEPVKIEGKPVSEILIEDRR